MTGLLCSAAALMVRPVRAADQPAANPSVAIDIDACAPGTPVSPTLYGAFFEEINRAGDGGLYAEMLQNRSFEDAPQPVAWTLIKPSAADASSTLDASAPPPAWCEPVAPDARAVIMGSASENDENSFAEPGKVIPCEEAVGNAAASFAYKLRASSITVLRLHAEN